MTTITAADFQVAPKAAHDGVGVRRSRAARHNRFSEVREARRQHVLQLAAVSTGILSVTVAASATIVLTLAP